MFVPRADAAATCTATGFIRDGIDLKAALINPSSVPATLDATGCEIGVYYNHNKSGGVVTLNQVDIWGAQYFGVAVNADGGPLTVHITNNFIHNIGNLPFDGSQHGVGLYLRAFFTHNLTGEVMGNTVSAYQKGGIVATRGGVKLSKWDNNKVYGLGHLNFIAQNGIQISYGAVPSPGEVLNNTVTGNSYIGTGDVSSGGILVLGGPGFGNCPDGDPCPYEKNVLVGINSTFTTLGPNFVFNNDVGIWMFNLAGDGVSAPPTPTTNL